ncbi:MAG TPA: hypothetical protein VGK67_35865 [Myxococcales bacterium]|jgi:threonine/homoserine efflux transporter RhtA
MRDHRRILGSLFLAWAALQAVTMVLLARFGEQVSQSLAWTLVRWALGALAVVVYGLVGLKLRAHDPRVRVFAIAFSALALISFPLGTALGIYGLWVLLRRPAEAPA